MNRDWSDFASTVLSYDPEIDEPIKTRSLVGDVAAYLLLAVMAGGLFVGIIQYISR